MATLASRGYKTLVGISTTAAANTTTDLLGQLVSAGGPDHSVEDVDVTNFDSTGRAREHWEGMIEGGELKFAMVYNKAKQTTIAAVLASTSTSKSIIIKFEDAGYFLCQGYLNAYGIEPAGDKDVVRGSFGWKVNGLPAFTAG